MEWTGKRERNKEKGRKEGDDFSSLTVSLSSSFFFRKKTAQKTSRGKAALLEGDIPNLERLARKGLRRSPPGTSAERAQKVAAAKDAAAALADGLHAPAKRYFPASSAGAAAGGGPSSSSSSPSTSSPSPNPSSSSPSTIQALKSKGKTVIMLDETKWGSRADADGYYSQSEAAAGFRKV